MVVIAGENGRHNDRCERLGESMAKAYHSCLEAIPDIDIATIKEFRDAAIRLAEHARRWRNREVSRRCEEIRIRLERRWGQVYGIGKKARDGRPSSNLDARDYRGAPTLGEMDVSYSPELALAGAREPLGR
jgi:hypothetical protein